MQWNYDMSKAPQDGRDVLLWSISDGGPYVAYFDEVHKMWFWTSYDLGGDQVVCDPQCWAIITEPTFDD